MAGQFVFIAVLLHWRKFACSPGAPRVFRMHPSRFRGRTLHPWQSFRRGRRIADRLRAESTCAIAGWKPQRSSRWARARFRPSAKYSPAVQLCLEEDLFVVPRARGPRAIQTDRAWRPCALCPPQAPTSLRTSRALWFWAQTSWRPVSPPVLTLASTALQLASKSSRLLLAPRAWLRELLLWQRKLQVCFVQKKRTLHRVSPMLAPQASRDLYPCRLQVSLARAGREPPPPAETLLREPSQNAFVAHSRSGFPRRFRRTCRSCSGVTRLGKERRSCKNSGNRRARTNRIFRALGNRRVGKV